MPQTFFHIFLYSRKYALIHLTPFHWQLCISKFCDITKGTRCPTKKFIFQFLTTFVLEHLTPSFFQVLFYGNRSFIPEILKPLS